MMNKSCLPFFVIRLFFLFFCFCFYFHLLCVNCTFYGTQKTKVSSVCLKLKYLTELKVYFPDLKDQNEIVESDERLCCRDGNVTCCFNSCTLFFYRTLGLSFYADHKCCPILFCLLYMSEMQHDFYSCMLTSLLHPSTRWDSIAHYVPASLKGTTLAMLG